MKNPPTAARFHELVNMQSADRDVILVDFCRNLHSADLAELFDEIEPEQAAHIFARLDLEQAAQVVPYLDEYLQTRIVELIPENRLARVVAIMFHDERVDLLQALPEVRAEAVFRMVAKSEREDILKLSSYVEGTVGAIMTSEYARLRPGMTARRAVDQLRMEAPNTETIYYSYVLDEGRHLLGSVSLRDLIIAKPDAIIDSMMTTDLVMVRTDESQEEVARMLAKYDLVAIPVVDSNQAMVGIVTFDDVADIAEDETTEDFQMMAPITELEAGVGDAGVWKMFRSRVPWLMALIVVNIFTGAGIARFEGTIQAMISLVFFMPLLIGSGGNAGSQSATLMARALATGEVHSRDWLRLLGREVGVAALLGLVMGAVVVAIGLYNADYKVAIIVALSMLACVLTGSLIGMSLPFLLTRLKLDPATASAPLVASIVDVSGVVIYLGIATWVLSL